MFANLESTQVVFSKPKILFMVAAFLSLVLSVTLWYTGSKDQGIFVGLWVPSILSLGNLVLTNDRSSQ
ncbi:MAG: hypothetical protein ACJ05G_10545 [Actinomycetota bacterium]|nr:hypothetical protein [Acidimicrobiales bacterium]